MTDQNWESAVNVITVLILGFLTALAADTTFDLYNQLTFHNYSMTGRMPQRKTFGRFLKTVYLQAGCLSWNLFFTDGAPPRIPACNAPQTP